MKKVLGIVVLGLFSCNLSLAKDIKCVEGNCINGQGTEIISFPKSNMSPGDNKYIGEFKDGKRHGEGKLTTRTGRTFVGEWKNGKKDGYGIWEDKYFKYIGYFKNGRIHGSGEYIAKNNQTLTHYIGEWKEGFQDGYGTAKYNNGSTYDGEFKKGQKHGQGSWKWENVGKYEGGWKEGKRDGQGTYTYLEDHKTAEGIYIGQWKDGKRHGQGTYTKKDGTIQKGIWKDNGFYKKD